MTNTDGIYRCFAGDSSDIWEVGFQTSVEGDPLELADLDANFSCKVAVKGTTIDRAVTAKNDANNRFRVWLTPTETAGLAARDHIVAIQIRNDTLTPPLLKETQITLRVRGGTIA